MLPVARVEVPATRALKRSITLVTLAMAKDTVPKLVTLATEKVATPAPLVVDMQESVALAAVVTVQVKYILNINTMKRLLFILFATFIVTNLCAQIQAGGHCNFNNSKGEVRNGKIYEVVRTSDDNNKTENTNSYGVQGSIEVKKVVNVGGNYSSSTSSTNNCGSSFTRSGYECCDDNTCTSNYNEGKSIYAESKKGKYLKPKK